MNRLERRVWLGFVAVVAVALAGGWLVYASSDRLAGVSGILSIALFGVLIVAVIRSLASQRRARAADARLGAIVEASSDAIMSLDLEGRIESWNAGAERIFGYTAAEARGQLISLIAPPDQAEGQERNLAALREGRQIVGQEAIRLAKDGRRVDVSLSAFPLQDGSGNLVGFGAIFRDITEAKRTENALRDSERRLATIFARSPVGISITRASDGVILEANDRLLELFEYSRDEGFGRTSAQLDLWVDRARRDEVSKMLATDGFLHDLEIQWRTRSGRILDTISSWDLLELGGEAYVLTLINDITERKRAEEALRESEQRWAMLFHASPTPISVSRISDGTMLDVNERWLDLFGFAREAVIGRTTLELGIWADPDARTGLLDRLREQGSLRDMELEWRTASGKLIDTITSWELLELGSETCVLTHLNDITARRDAERDRERIFNLSSDLIAVADYNGKIRSANPAALAALGISQEELLARPVLDLIHPEDRERAAATMARLVRGAPSVTFEGRARARDGSYLWIDLFAAGNQKERVAYIFARDLTARKEMEEALRAGEERFRSVVETATDAIIITDRWGNIEAFNPAAEETFGYTSSEVTGRNLRILIPSPQKEEHDTYIADFIARGESQLFGLRREMTGQRKDGSLFPHDLAVNPMYVGGELKFTAIIRDITARKAMEAELLEAKEAAEEASRAKSAFLSRMSHELRTPLNVILGFGQVLQLDPLDPQQTESVDYILKAGRHLLELINEVLDISRIEAGRLALSIEPVRVDELLSDAMLLVRPLADERRVALKADFEGCSDYILADRQRIKQVLLNLLSNAIKYNREGGSVSISCARIENSAFRIAVNDTGYGIAHDRFDRLFNPFDRLGAEATTVEGTGLGLALSKHLVEAMGGTIGVESTPDVGSTFSVVLPLGEPPTDPKAPQVESAPTSEEPRLQRSVLYIEDNLSNLNLMERILTHRQGFRLLAAMQGSLGLELARDHQPDLILLDLHLPDMPGQDVLRELKANPATRGIPIVVVSADATVGQRDRLLNAGAHAYLTKPFNLPDLLALADSLLREAK